MLDGYKVYTDSDRTSLHLVFGSSRYMHLCCSMLVVGVTRERERERERKGSQVSYMGGGPIDYMTGFLR